MDNSRGVVRIPNYRERVVASLLRSLTVKSRVDVGFGPVELGGMLAERPSAVTDVAATLPISSRAIPISRFAY